MFARCICVARRTKLLLIFHVCAPSGFRAITAMRVNTSVCKKGNTWIQTPSSNSSQVLNRLKLQMQTGGTGDHCLSHVICWVVGLAKTMSLGCLSFRVRSENSWYETFLFDFWVISKLWCTWRLFKWNKAHSQTHFYKFKVLWGIWVFIKINIHQS